MSSFFLVFPQQEIFIFCRVLFVFLLAAFSLAGNYLASFHPDFSHDNGPLLWISIIILQLISGIGFVSLLQLQSIYSKIIILNLLLPVTGLILESPEHIQQIFVFFPVFVFALQTAWCIRPKMMIRFYHALNHYALQMRHMYSVYGLGLLIEDTWKRNRIPTVLRVIWLIKLATQAVTLVYVKKKAVNDAADATYFISWDDFWDVAYNLIISGCDSWLAVMGMSAVISSITHSLGLVLLSFIGSTEEENGNLSFVAPVYFFISSLQTGMSGLEPEERLVQLSHDMCILLIKVLHFVQEMTDPVLKRLSASHMTAVHRHLPVLLVPTFLFVLPIFLSYVLWHYYVLNSWLFAVTALCVQLCLKVIVSLTVYTLFMYYNVLWEKLDDYVYYVRSTGNMIECVFGVILFGNTAYVMMFESESTIQACVMSLQAYFSIYLEAKNGWKTFMNLRTAVKKMYSLLEIRDPI